MYFAANTFGPNQKCITHAQIEDGKTIFFLFWTVGKHSILNFVFHSYFIYVRFAIKSVSNALHQTFK